MSGLLKIAGPNHEQIIKEAILGALASGAANLAFKGAKNVVLHPIQSAKTLGRYTGKGLTAAFNVGDVAHRQAKLNMAQNTGALQAQPTPVMNM